MAWGSQPGFYWTMSSCKARHFCRLYGEHWNFERCILGSAAWCSCNTAACNHLSTHHFVRMFALALLLLLALALALALVLVVVVATAYTFSRFCDPKNRQIGGVFTLEAKKHCKYWCFFRFGSPKPRYLRCFWPLVAQITVFTMFFGQCLAKTLIFNAVSTMLQDVVSICEKDKNTVFYDLFVSRAQQKIVKKLFKNGPKSTL